MKKVIFSSILFLSLAVGAKAQGSYNLDFSKLKGQKVTYNYNGKTYHARSYTNIIYVKNPVDTAHQKMNIFIPEEYFQGKKVNGYSSKTAPMFVYNRIGGYMPADACPLDGSWPLRPGEKPHTIDMNKLTDTSDHRTMTLAGLARGYVVVSPAARGRVSSKGKAPAALVDLKSVVRYLKYNDKVIPGDANRIISDGTSAGGAMSSLLGATGNSSDYKLYLDEAGAAPATDDIFATQAYCPITNLDHADMAYEWEFHQEAVAMERFRPGQKEQKKYPLSRVQMLASKELKAQFPAYVNSLDLKDAKGNLLTLNADGTGSFADWILGLIQTSAQKKVDKGEDLSSFSSWLEVKDGKAKIVNVQNYIKYLTRMKLPPAFDAFDLSSNENQEFGTETIDKQHFTQYSYDHSTVPGSTMASEHLIKIMNPMYYISQPGVTTSKHWRICHGTRDSDTSMAIPAILAAYLQNRGYDVTFKAAWNRPHSGDYDADELFDWIDSLCKKQ